MKQLLVRVIIALFLGLSWLLVIYLNFNGFLIEATNVLFYVISVLYLLAILPDFKYMISRRNKADSVTQFRMFVGNVYRYIFVFLSVVVIFYFLNNLFYDPFRSDSDVYHCLEKKKMIVSERGLLNISSFKMHNGSVTDLDLEVYVKVDGVYKKLKVSRVDGVVSCEF